MRAGAGKKRELEGRRMGEQEDECEKMKTEAWEKRVVEGSRVGE